MTGSNACLVRFLAITLARDDPKRAALILSCLDPDLASDVFEALPEPGQLGIFRHMASGDVRHDIPEDITAIVLDSVRSELGGSRTAAELLNRASADTERRILTELDHQDSKLAEEVRHQAFTFDDIVRLTDKDIQQVLRETDTQDLAIAMRGANERTHERIFANLSERIGEKVKEYMAHGTATEPSMIEEIQRNIVCTVRQIQQARFTMDRADHDLPV